MTSVVSIFNSLLTHLFGLVCWPLKWMGPFWSLAILSWLGGMFMVWVFGKVSNQAAIQIARDRLSSDLIALRLFKDDLRVFFRIQFEVLLGTFKYLRHSLFPMLILMIPTMIILIQLNLHYGARPLKVGEQALVKVKLRDPSTLATGKEILLQAPANLKIESSGVRIVEDREVCWRIRAVSPGKFDLTASDGVNEITKSAVVGGRLEGVSTLRTGEGWLASILYPGEPPIPGQSAFESIEITYPEMEISVLGRNMNWMILFLVLSLCFGYASKGFLGVQI